MKRMICGLCLISVAFSAEVGAAPFKSAEVRENGLTKDQAKQVLMVVLRHEKYRLSMPGVFIDGNLADEQGNPPHPGYFDFSLGYDSPKAGATDYLGLFSVSVKTGDVWEINSCKNFHFPALAQLQAMIMKRTKQTFAGEKDARKGLGCTDE